MFEDLFRNRRVIAHHCKAPLADERKRYLRYCSEKAFATGTLRERARNLLWTVEEGIAPFRGITLEEINGAVKRWQRERESVLSDKQLHARMSQVADWCNFLGYLNQAVVMPQPFENCVNEFCEWLKTERGLSSTTIKNYRWQSSEFFKFYFMLERQLGDIRLEDIDAFLAAQAEKGWSRVSIAACAKRLRAFFRHAVRRGWCDAVIPQGITGPRLFRQENLPMGPAWSEVIRLVKALDTEEAYDIRDRAIIMLCAVYGLRSAEVSNLCLEDLDWDRSQLSIWRPKQRHRQSYPLTLSVGEAIIRYLRYTRPNSSYRELFLALKAPYLPLTPGAVGHVVARRFHGSGVNSRRHGAHALRHACATHLVNQGLSFKEVGDHLGHCSSSATGVYAKVDLIRLREVAVLNEGGVI